MGSFIHGFMDYLFIGLVRVLIAGQTAFFHGLTPWISQAITALDPATHAACIFSGIRRTSDFAFRLKYKKTFRTPLRPEMRGHAVAHSGLGQGAPAV